MENPKKFECPLNEYGYHMEVDIRRDDCQRERSPHWHLVHGRNRIGVVETYDPYNPVFTEKVSKRIEKEVIELTIRYRNEIEETYEWNRENGSRW